MVEGGRGGSRAEQSQSWPLKGPLQTVSFESILSTCSVVS